MSNQSAQSLYELVGAPLMALVDAESQAAKATANFIQEMGFKKDAPATSPAALDKLGRRLDFGDLRMVTFKSQKRLADGSHRKYKIEVPLLSLLPIPALQIKDAELEFFARVVEFPKKSKPAIKPKAGGDEGDPDAGEQPEEKKAKEFGIFHLPGRDLKATFAPTSGGDSASRKQRLDMEIKIKIKMEQADIPAGLGSLFNLMQENISSTET